MTTPRLEVLIGMIASGKTTYARKRAKEGALIISHDDLTQMLHGEYRYEKGLRRTYIGMMDHLAYVGLDADRDVIIDRTHLTRESRAFWVEFARDLKARLIAVEFPIELPHIHAERRCKHDSRGRACQDWIGVAEHHYVQAKAEPLDWQAEGFDEYRRIEHAD